MKNLPAITYLFYIFIFYISYFIFYISAAEAAILCEPAYGGGLSEFCVQTQITPTPAPSGFPVFPAPQVSKTPATGPEALPLIGIVSSGLVGWILRKKTGK